jgi:cell division protease FtsH
MNKNFYITFFFISCVLFAEKTNCSFDTKSEHFSFSKEYLQKFITNHPAIFTSLIGLTVWSQLYPAHVTTINDFIKKEHPDAAFATCLAILGYGYYHKKKIIEYINSDNQFDEIDQDLEEPSQSGPSYYSQFSKSGVQIYTPGQIKTTFKDVAGLETAKEDLSDILMFLKHPRRFKIIGAHCPKGILLSGAPGNGKTLLARALAGEASCPFLYITASAMIEAVVGMGSARIRHLFCVAKDLAPCIIFIDEIDSIGRKRSCSSLGGDTEMAQTLNQLLSEMDGFEQQENPIIIIGATNRAHVLDEALTRPGRFDRKIEIHNPYIKDRIEILKVHFKNVVTNSDINLEKIAQGTIKFSGAQLANLVNESALLAIRKGKTMVDMEDVDQARDFIILGRETKGMDISDEEFYNTAIHEAGHALTTVFQEHATPLYKVTITPRGPALGITYSIDNKEQYSMKEEELRAQIIVLLGGSVAEEIMINRRGVGASSDLTHARKLATAMVMRFGMTQEFKDVTFEEFIDNQVDLPDSIATKLHQEINKIITECRTVAIQIINEHKTALLQLCDMLIEQKTVLGSDVYRLCKVTEPNQPSASISF